MSSVVILFFFFFKQKTAYEMRISDWSSDVCSSDLLETARLLARRLPGRLRPPRPPLRLDRTQLLAHQRQALQLPAHLRQRPRRQPLAFRRANRLEPIARIRPLHVEVTHPEAGQRRLQAVDDPCRSEEHPSELQSLMRTSYA